MRSLLIAVLHLLLLAAVARAGAARPNIIVIFSDDHGYADLSCQDVFDDVRTPHIDSLAAGGVRMTAGYVTAPQCVPSRAGLLAGQYQNRFGVESNAEPLDGFNAVQTIAERLKAAGYATGMTGKWHLGPQPQIPTHGFDDVYFKNANREGWANFNLDGSDREPGPEHSKEYHLDVNSAAACAFIRRHHDEPFFFYCAYRAPHVPLDAPPKYLSRFPGEMPERRRQALAMISAMDDGVGQMLKTLREHDLEERTLIFFIGDNGAPLKIHKHDAPGGGPGWDGSLNDPLNGEKGMLSEGGIRVPFVAYWKGTLPAGLKYDQPVISLDVAATAVALAGLPDDPQLDGVNLIPYLTGEKTTAPHEILFWRWIAQSAARQGKWKYLRGGARKYLFDLEADPEEQHNLIGEHPQIADRLEQKLARWAADLNPPGLETQSMSPVWESYFDFYLDGKPAPPLRAKSGQPSAAQGWLVRSGKLTRVDGAIRITPEPGQPRRAFITTTDVNVPGPAVATVKLRASKAGQASISWRTAGQKDFPAGQSVSFEAAEGWQTVQVEVPAKGRIIHIRFVPPQNTTDVKRITLSSVEGKARRVWSFEGK